MPLDLDAARPGAIALLGVPWDENSSQLRGAAAAPAVIRSTFADPELNASAEDGGNLARDPRLGDVGDVTIPGGDPEAAIAIIIEAVDGVLGRGARVLALGGDHAVSFPLVKAHAERLGAFSVVQIDAHPDLYDELDGNRYSHACPFARIMESKLATRLVQIGIRASTPHQREQAARFGVETIDLREARPPTHGLPEGPVYLSVDLDGLDPAFVPGVAHPEPGGLSTREVIRIIQQLPGPLVGADIVECNPRLDVRGATALVASKLLKEIAARMLREGFRFPVDERHEEKA